MARCCAFPGLPAVARIASDSGLAGRGARLLLATASLALAACDLPTEAPKWETTWVVPAESTTMAVSSLLPSSVTVTPDESAFVLSVGGTSFTNSLGDVCSSCQALDGTTAPKPAFAATVGSGVALPEDVLSAALSSGSITVELTNGFNFDPIRPSGTARGSIKVTVTAGSAVLAEQTIDGVAEPFPANTTKSVALNFAPATLTDSIKVAVALDSPAGDPVEIDTDLAFTAEATPGDLTVSEAEVMLASRTVQLDQVDLGLESVDQNLADRARSGALRLEISNPFAVSGELTMQITGPGTTISKALPIAAGSSAPRIEFSGTELRSILGESGVTLGASGTVSAPSGSITIQPSQLLVITSKLELVLGPEEE